jgi:hypothetical protein
VAAAFVADAAFRFFFPDDARYSANVAAFPGNLFDRRVAQRTAWVINGGSSVGLSDRPATATADLGAHAPVEGAISRLVGSAAHRGPQGLADTGSDQLDHRGRHAEHPTRREEEPPNNPVTPDVRMLPAYAVTVRSAQLSPCLPPRRTRTSQTATALPRCMRLR